MQIAEAIPSRNAYKKAAKTAEETQKLFIASKLSRKLEPAKKSNMIRDNLLKEAAERMISSGTKRKNEEKDDEKFDHFFEANREQLLENHIDEIEEELDLIQVAKRIFNKLPKKDQNKWKKQAV